MDWIESDPDWIRSPSDNFCHWWTPRFSRTCLLQCEKLYISAERRESRDSNLWKTELLILQENNLNFIEAVKNESKLIFLVCSLCPSVSKRPVLIASSNKEPAQCLDLIVLRVLAHMAIKGLLLAFWIGIALLWCDTVNLVQIQNVFCRQWLDMVHASLVPQSWNHLQITFDKSKKLSAYLWKGLLCQSKQTPHTPWVHLALG